MADDDAMLTMEPDEPVIHNVRLQQAYRTTVTLRNNTRNAMELTIRAGSPERWAVAPSTVFLEAGRTMRVDLRLKLTRELRPRRPRRRRGRGATRPGEDDNGAHRQRDVFHVKSRTSSGVSASFVMATPDEIAAATARDPSRTAGGASLSPRRAPATRGGVLAPSTERSRSASPADGAASTSRPDESTRGRSAPSSPPGSDPDGVQTSRAWTRRASTRRPRALDERLETREREARRAGPEGQRGADPRAHVAPGTGATGARGPRGGFRLRVPRRMPRRRARVAGDALLAESRAKAAELAGANAALRSRCQELDGELQASREEAAGLRRRLAALESDKVPELWTWWRRLSRRSARRSRRRVAQGAARARGQGLRCSRRARERRRRRARSAARATRRSRRRAGSWTRARRGSSPPWRNRASSATRRASLAESRDGAERRARDTVTALKAEIDALEKSSRDDAENAARARKWTRTSRFFARRRRGDRRSRRPRGSGGLRLARVAAERGGAARRRAHAARRARRRRRARARRARARRAAGAPGAEVRTAELGSARRAIAAALERSRGDSLLTGAAARAAAGGDGCARPAAERREAASARRRRGGGVRRERCRRR